MMRHLQLPLDSGFGARTNAAEILTGCDLNHKLALIAAGHSGLGLETSKALANAGAKVVVAARDAKLARSQTQGIAKLEVVALDLASLASIQSFASQFLATGRHIDILICNAGIMACPELRVGRNWEAQFAVNHLGHYLLVNLLWPALIGGARVVMVSSAGHHQSAIRWHDPHFNQSYDQWLAYGQSKTANALFAVQLDHLGQQQAVRAFSLHPGKIFTPLQRYLSQAEMIAAGWLDAAGQLADPSFKTVAQGAATQVWVATSAQLAGLGGLYCEDCDVARMASAQQLPFVGVQDYAIDPEQATRLWQFSKQLTGVDSISHPR
jgi:NAD(P)-dependent dehydrogenase (short-subunit alcohol dehydrogenase family)